MPRFLSAVTVVVPDYDAAIDFYVGALGFDLIEDTPLSAEKRWILVAPGGSGECRLLLAKATSGEQALAIGNQTGGRVAFFLTTDDFTRDRVAFEAAGVRFEEPTRHEPYGTVAVFSDPFGNLWDLIEPT